MRKVSRTRYIVAALITIGIFLLGLFLGLVIENQRLEFIQKEDRVQKLDYNSLQVLYAYIDQLSQTRECSTIPQIYDLSLEHLEETRIRLENYDKDATLNQDEFDILKREYVQAQLRYWLLAQRINDRCKLDIMTILYFYSTEKECPDCSEQAFILTYLKNIFGIDLLIFAIDSNYVDEPLIPLLKQSYNVTEYPTVVVGDEIFVGFTVKDILLEEVCDGYREKSEHCS